MAAYPIIVPTGWPRIFAAMCGGSPLRRASVANSLRKSWGENDSGAAGGVHAGDQPCEPGRVDQCTSLLQQHSRPVPRQPPVPGADHLAARQQPHRRHQLLPQVGGRPSRERRHVLRRQVEPVGAGLARCWRRWRGGPRGLPGVMGQHVGDDLVRVGLKIDLAFYPAVAPGRDRFGGIHVCVVVILLAVFSPRAYRGSGSSGPRAAAVRVGGVAMVVPAAHPGPVRVSVHEPLTVSPVAPVTSVSPAHRQLLDTIGLPLTALPAPPSWPASWLRLSGPMVVANGLVTWTVALIVDTFGLLTPSESPDVTEAGGSTRVSVIVPL